MVNIVFDDGSAHSLSGGKNDDRLYGNGGNDTLYGNGGDDYLEGGSGDDTYHFDSTITGGFGADTIVDTNGTLNIDGITTFNVSQLAAGGNVYARVDGNGSPLDDYRFTVAGGDLLIAKINPVAAGDQNSILIKNWSDGEFGITLTTTSQPTTPGTGGTQVITVANRDVNHPDGRVLWHTAGGIYPSAALHVDMTDLLQAA